MAETVGSALPYTACQFTMARQCAVLGETEVKVRVVGTTLEIQWNSLTPSLAIFPKQRLGLKQLNEMFELLTETSKAQALKFRNYGTCSLYEKYKDALDEIVRPNIVNQIEKQESIHRRNFI